MMCAYPYIYMRIHTYKHTAGLKARRHVHNGHMYTHTHTQKERERKRERERET